MNALATTLSIGSAFGAGVAAWGAFVPTSGIWGRVYSHGPATEPRYALTFDDGPTRGPTDEVLDALAKMKVPAAFFVVGANAQRCPDLLVRMHAEGHLIGNHSLDHDHYALFRRPPYWNRQFDETDAAIEQAIGQRPAMFRPPMGHKGPHMMAAARRRGQAVIAWTHRAVDGVRTTPQRILERLAPRTRGGDILLLHDGLEPHAFKRDPSATIAAITPLILRLRDRGLEPARLDELLGLPAYVVSPSSPVAAPIANS
jgi:peptidoglycan/xylan/chitin deacetylase (PgdA/CDA1 family)